MIFIRGFNNLTCTGGSIELIAPEGAQLSIIFPFAIHQNQTTIPNKRPDNVYRTYINWVRATPLQSGELVSLIKV